MIRNKYDYYFYLKADLASHHIKEWRWWYKFKHTIIYYQRLLRKIEFHQNCKTGAINKIRLILLRLEFKRLSERLGFTISPNIFEAGLNIAHYGSIVVSHLCKVGENCRIHSAVNIGEINGEAPTIGDNVFIAPGVKIYGGITIGDNVAIGANAVVNKDVPSNVTIGGVPAKIISDKNSANVINYGTTIVESKALSG